MTTDIAVTLHMPADELRALAQFLKRVDYGTVDRFAGLTKSPYGARCEVDVMWCALGMLRAALAEAGFAPR